MVPGGRTIVQTPSPTWYASAGWNGSHPKYCAMPYAPLASAAAATARSIAFTLSSRPAVFHATIAANSSTAAWVAAPYSRHVLPNTDSARFAEKTVDTPNDTRLAASQIQKVYGRGIARCRVLPMFELQELNEAMERIDE